ncbi:hypothetical protein VitviT2T_028122 [Vitis vinifera]|uniref:Uncharacterized protein n=1 Tax=Vitis vinifera TaxID=29760 RepID=A0ABY9DT72_VITVI|nr:hypothetical protein VitviT2T_028122 [Vitis vinifera]
MSVRGCEMALMCQRVVSQLRNTLSNGFSAAKWRISRRGDFAAISQLRNRCTGLRNGTCVPRGLFAAAKNFRKEGWAAAKPFRSGRPFSQRQSRVIHVIHNPELFITSRALSSQFRVIHVNHNPELFIASSVLRSQLKVIHFIPSPEIFIAFRVMGSQPRIIHIIHNLELVIASRGLSSLDPESFI